MQPLLLATRTIKVEGWRQWESNMVPSLPSRGPTILTDFWLLLLALFYVHLCFPAACPANFRLHQQTQKQKPLIDCLTSSQDWVRSSPYHQYSASLIKPWLIHPSLCIEPINALPQRPISWMWARERPENYTPLTFLVSFYASLLLLLFSWAMWPFIFLFLKYICLHGLHVCTHAVLSARNILSFVTFCPLHVLV